MSILHQRLALAPGHLIKYKLKQNDEWKTVRIVSKAGKTTGTFKNCYNVDYDGDRYYIHLDKVHNFERVFHTNEDNDITQDIRKNWTQLSSPIAFAGVTKIYNHYKQQISTKEIERILSTIPTYTKYKQRKNSKLHNPFFCIIYISNGKLTSLISLSSKSLTTTLLIYWLLWNVFQEKYLLRQ